MFSCAQVRIPPGALPLGVTVIDAAILLFGRVFPQISLKHRSQLLNHFIATFKSVKSQKSAAVQINIILAVLASLKVCSMASMYIRVSLAGVHVKEGVAGMPVGEGVTVKRVWLGSSGVWSVYRV